MVLDWQVVQTVFWEQGSRELSSANFPNNWNHAPTISELRFEGFYFLTLRLWNWDEVERRWPTPFNRGALEFDVHVKILVRLICFTSCRIKTMPAKQKRQPGELESLVLGCLWDAGGSLSSQEVQAHCSKQGELALTTVLTVLSRLEDKGLVAREVESGRSLSFRAVESREEHTARVMLNMIEEEANPALAFSFFAKGLSKAQRSSLKKILGE